MKVVFNPIRLALGLALASMAEASPAAEKKVQFCKKEYDLDTGVVYFAFGNGETVEIDSNSIPEDTRKQCTLHGISQKGGDSYAGAKGNYAEAIQSVKDIRDQLYAGAWKADRDSEGRPRLGELAEAIARIKGVDLERATAAVEKATDEQRKEWRSNAKVKFTIQQIRTEKAAKALEEAADKTEVNVDL